MFWSYVLKTVHFLQFLLLELGACVCLQITRYSYALRIFFQNKTIFVNFCYHKQLKKHVKLQQNVAIRSLLCYSFFFYIKNTKTIEIYLTPPTPNPYVLFPLPFHLLCQSQQGTLVSLMNFRVILHQFKWSDSDLYQ